MNRVGFMSQLEGLLVDIPAAEREEALQYYNDYFDDAGVENEQSVISSLGSPRAIAENIKAEIKGEMVQATAKASDGAVTKYGQIVVTNSDQNANDASSSAETADTRSTYGTAGGQGGAGGAGGQGGAGGMGGYGYDRSYHGSYEAQPVSRKNKLPVWALVLIIIGLLFAAPPVFGLLAGIAGMSIGFIAAWFGLVIACGAGTFGLLVAAVVLLVVAILTLAISPAVLIGVLGVSMLCGSFGLFGLMITVWLAGKVTPAIFKGYGFCIRFIWRGLGKIWHAIFG